MGDAIRLYDFIMCVCLTCAPCENYYPAIFVAHPFQ